MPDPVSWYTLGRTVSDPQLIMEMIDEKLLAHNQEPAAHGQTSEAVHTHRSGDPADHPDESITTAKIKNLAVTNAKIKDATIEYAKIKTVDAATVTTGVLTGRKLQSHSGDEGIKINVGSYGAVADAYLEFWNDEDQDQGVVYYKKGTTDLVFEGIDFDLSGGDIKDVTDLEVKGEFLDDIVLTDGKKLYIKSPDGTKSGYFEWSDQDNLDLRGLTKMVIHGALEVDGFITKTGGGFKIPHPSPSKPNGSLLHHAFVESPTAGDNLYRFKVKVKNGKAVINLPDYFKYLNKNPQAWVTAVNVLGIARAECDLKKVRIEASEDGIYNVLVIGTRKDALAVKAWSHHGVEET